MYKTNYQVHVYDRKKNSWKLVIKTKSYLIALIAENILWCNNRLKIVKRYEYNENTKS